MPYRQEYADLRVAPVTYPGVDWDAVALVARVKVPRDETVGWLIRQGDDRISWIGVAKEGDLGEPLARDVFAALRAGAAAGRKVGKVWDEVLGFAPHDFPTEQSLPALAETIRRLA